jgi:hypothetical protein
MIDMPVPISPMVRLKEGHATNKSAPLAPAAVGLRATLTVQTPLIGVTLVE